MIISRGKKNADVLFILEPAGRNGIDDNHENCEIITPGVKKLLQKCRQEIGLKTEDCAVITPAPRFPSSTKDSDKREKEFLLKYKDAFLKELNTFKPKVIVYFGKYAGFQLLQKPIKISKTSGVILEYQDFKCPIMGLSAPKMVVRNTNQRELFLAHFRMLGKLKKNNYVYSADIFNQSDIKYEWRTDISDILKNKPKMIAYDTETTGLAWQKKSVYPIVLQMTFEDGTAICSPCSKNYFPEYFGDYDLDKLISQWKEILEDPEVLKCGHNIKFDMHMTSKLGIELEGVAVDTLQLIYTVDENMPSKGLDDAVKRWVPQMAGYADFFNSQVDKSNMLEVDPDQMLLYAGGDTDATFRLCKVLYNEAMKDKASFKRFQKVQMPGIKMFYELEKHGIRIDDTKLDELSVEFTKELNKRHNELLELAPKKVLRKHMWGGKNQKTDPLSLSRQELIIDILFSEDGYNLEPKVFTKGTKSLDNKDERVPSVSTSDHLPYFKESGIDFVPLFIDYAKLGKMMSTYVGSKEDNKGFWQYLYKQPDTEYQKIYPSFNLHTETGRCLHEDTEVKLKRGWKKIKDIQIGDLVLTHTGEYKPVVKKYDNGKQEVYSIYCDFEVVHATLKHKFLMADGKWKTMKHIFVGDEIMFWEKGKFFKRAVNKEGYLRGQVKTYDIEVKDDHSFIANGFVSHNSNSSNPNAQNIPSRGRLAKAYKKIFIPEDGYTIVACDLSQAELRVIAWMANEPTMIDLYKRGEDIHTITAAEVVSQMSVKEFMLLDEDTRDSRRYKAKPANFGLVYGQSAYGLKIFAKTTYDLELTEEECEAIRTRFYNKYSRLPEWHNELIAEAKRTGYVRYLHGGVRHVPDIYSKDKFLYSEAVRTVINSPIQGFSSDIGVMVLNNIRKDFDHDIVRTLSFVHDAGYFEVKTELLEEYASYIKWYFQNPPLEKIFGLKPPIPILSDVEIGPNFSDLKKRDDLLAIKPKFCHY